MRMERKAMIGFIGAGAMGSAIMQGAMSKGHSDIVFSEAHDERARALAAQTGARHATNIEVVQEASVVILAVKPNVMGGVLDEIADAAKERGTVLVSIAAGTTLETLAAHLAPNQPIVRVMPNVAAQIGQSMSALCPNEYVDADSLDAVRAIFEAVGKVEILAEKDFAAFAAIAGCSPAFTFEYIDALARGAVANGIPKAQAVRIAAQAVLGSAALVLERAPEHTPATLADLVQSPGGTTVVGVVALEEAGFGRATVKAVQASVDKDVELQG